MSKRSSLGVPKIESGIPLPASSRTAEQDRPFWTAVMNMSVGDSFVIEMGDKTASLKRAAAIRARMHRYGHRVAWRALPDDSVRIWRTA